MGIVEKKAVGRPPGRKTIVVLNGVHPNERPITDRIFERAREDPRLAELAEKANFFFLTLPVELTSHGRASIAKRYLTYLYEKDPVIRRAIDELNGLKKGLYENRVLDGLALSNYFSRKLELLEALGLKIEEHLGDMGSLEDPELVSILEAIRRNRDFLEKGEHEGYCEREVGEKPDFIVQLHSTSDEILKEQTVKRYGGFEEKLKGLKGRVREAFRKSLEGSVSLETPAEYEESQEFESVLDLPGAEILMRQILEHPLLGEHEGLMLDVPMLMPSLYKKPNDADRNYMMKAGDYIYTKKAKEEQEHERIEKGTELLIRTLRELV